MALQRSCVIVVVALKMLRSEDTRAVYRWEKGIDATWETVQEDEHGNIIAGFSERDRSIRAKRNRITQSIRRGLIRYLVIALDCSLSSLDNDYKPCRMEASKACLEKFILEFFDQNPISQISTIVTRDRIAERISELSGNAKNHIHLVKGLMKAEGLASLQNTVSLAISTLRHIPNYGHRELLIIYSSISTCDPGDIFKTIKEAKKLKIRINVICLLAEIFICKQLAELTGGTFTVALDATHLSELLQRHTVPPPEVEEENAAVTDFIYMGFPKRVFDVNPSYGFEGKKMKLSTDAYICPRCHTRTTDIPTNCCVCNLQLNSSSHIARSHHHLFPVPNFIEFEMKTIDEVLTPVCLDSTWTNSNENQGFNGAADFRCQGCLDGLGFEGKIVFKCPQCFSIFCVECDLFIHDSLHNCPGCG